MMTAARWQAGILIALAISLGCRPSAAERSADASESTSRLATSKEQAQLWQDAADRGAPGLDRVPAATEPIQQRRSSPAPGGRSTSVPPQSITIPTGVVNAIRVVEFPSEPSISYTGPATVESATDERIRLNLGSRGFLTILVRVGKNPLPVVKGEAVRVAYASHVDPLSQDVVIGIRKTTGAGIVEVVRAGAKPVQADIPLFDFTASQLATEPTSPIRISGPNLAPQNVSPGEMVDLKNFTVFIVGSAGVGKGADVAQIDGTPYALNVMVWKVP